jgi:hypothetical protein
MDAFNDAWLTRYPRPKLICVDNSNYFRLSQKLSVIFDPWSKSSSKSKLYFGLVGGNNFFYFLLVMWFPI